MMEVAGITEELKACDPYALGGADEHAEGAGGGNCADRADLSIILQAEAATCGLCLFCNSAISFP